MHSQSPILHYNPSGNGSNRRPWGMPLSRSSVYPRVPRETNIPLPHYRLSPLIDHEEPLPEVPFTIKLATTLIWGEWRLFPATTVSQQRRRMDAHFVAATLPGVEELLMVVGPIGQSAHQIVKIRPRERGAVVSVSDVIEAVEEVLHNTQQFVSAGGFLDNAQSFGRSHDGKLVWRGLKAVCDDDGTLVLTFKL